MSSTPLLAFLHFNLRRRIVGFIGVSVATVAIALTLVFYLQMSGVMTEELRTRGEMIGLSLSNNLAFAVFSSDRVGLDAAAVSTLRDIPDVAYVAFRGSNGEMLAKALHPSLKTLIDEQLPKHKLAVGDRVDSIQVKLAGAGILAIAAPAFIQEKKDSGKGADPFDPLSLGTEKPEPAKAAVTTNSQVGLVQLGFFMDSQQDKVSAIASRALFVGFLVMLGASLLAYFVARQLTTPLEKLTQIAAGIARGDLDQRVESTSSDEIGELARSFDTMSSGLRATVIDLHTAAAEVQREASVILTTASRQAAMASEQATTINETSATATEIAQTSQQATDYANSVIKITERADELSRDGQKVVGESVAGMGQLGEQVRTIATSITDLSERTLQIGDIISTVKDVAEQSNVLALNASIEAAKAGEQGRGFAVVAMEMRNLAEQSKLAAAQVRAILGEVQKGTRAAVAATEEGSRRASAAIELAESAGNAILGLAEVSRESALAARQIAGNTRQQTVGVEQIVAAITEQSRAMGDSVEGTRQIEQVAGNLSQLSRRLAEVVSRYRVTMTQTPERGGPSGPGRPSGV